MEKTSRKLPHKRTCFAASWACRAALASPIRRAKVGRRLAHPAKQVGQFAAKGRLHPPDDPIDTPLDVAELIEQGQEAVGPQRRFGQEPCRVPAAAEQAPARRFALGGNSFGGRG